VTAVSSSGGSAHRRATCAYQPQVGFLIEQTLGHRTHGANLRAIIDADSSVQPTWLPIEWDVSGFGGVVPIYASNWTIRSGLRARRALRRSHELRPLDSLFVHSQVPAVLLGRWLERVPTVVSLDATPEQYDTLGASYGHTRSNSGVEAVKWRANKRCFDRARHLVTWSDWARQGLIAGYGISPEKVTVIPPGVRLHEWTTSGGRGSARSEVRILFVGADLERKGGYLLLDAVRRLRAASADGLVEVVVDIVTQTPVSPEPGVVVHRDLRPNSPALRALYHDADIFCLPTLGDCLPMVLSEAGAAGTAMVASDVGAVSEVVRHGETGLLVPPSDGPALFRALEALIHDGDLRRRLGSNARRLVEQEFDADTNAARLLWLLRGIASGDATSEFVDGRRLEAGVLGRRG
jgi:glycosyltransferase involved in cell wall biosynthesis